MKKIYTLFLLAGLAAAGCSKSDSGPNRIVTDDFDPLFAQELQNRGYIADAAYITPAQVENIATLDVSGTSSDYGKLTSLRGIEYFASLTSLDCSANRLTELNVSGNASLTELSCSNNELTSLDVSHNPALESLSCSSNQLTSLDVSRNPALVSLSCSSNQLKGLDVAGNTSLTELQCSNNVLGSLLLSSGLVSLSCDWNPLGIFDISECAALTTLHCYSCALGALDVTRNAALSELYCAGNYLKELDLSRNTSLFKLYCYDNELSSLDISRNKQLAEFSCERNPGVEQTDEENPDKTTGVFAVTAWFDNDSVPTGASDEGVNYQFTTGSWEYEYLNLNGSVSRRVPVTIDYSLTE